jgi:hypothetical protein
VLFTQNILLYSAASYFSVVSVYDRSSGEFVSNLVVISDEFFVSCHRKQISDKIPLFIMTCPIWKQFFLQNASLP